MLSDAQVQLLLKPYVGQKLSYLGHQQLTAKISQAYSDAGWVARVYLPEQDVTDGHIVIQIVEAFYGDARLQGAEPVRLKMSEVLSRLDAQLSVGKPLNTALDRTLLLILDLPGVNINASLQVGKDRAETALLLSMSDASRLTGEVAVVNSGSRSNSSNRVELNVNLFSPAGQGDLATGNLVHSEGSEHLRLAYSVPVGSDGWRVGVNVSGLQYRVLAPEFSALNASGNASGVGLEGTYPIICSRQSNFYLQLNADDMHAHNESLSAVQSDYQIESYDAMLSGNQFYSQSGQRNVGNVRCYYRNFVRQCIFFLEFAHLFAPKKCIVNRGENRF